MVNNRKDRRNHKNKIALAIHRQKYVKDKLTNYRCYVSSIIMKNIDK